MWKIVPSGTKILRESKGISRMNNENGHEDTYIAFDNLSDLIASSVW